MKINKPSPNAMYAGIHFFNESDAPLPIDLPGCKRIIDQIEKEENCRFHLVEIVFVDEEKIVEVNREHLKHDYVTDVISFRYDQQTDGQSIEGTLFCCAPRIRWQAAEYNQPVEEEFKRIVIHGLLHLAGYEDKNEQAQKKMRKKEEFYLGQSKG